jgi:polyphosphate kinase 2
MAREELRRLQIELCRLQRRVAETGAKVLAIFEGRDAAGKGGVIRRISRHLNPRGCRVVALRTPTDAERTQWYFQRYVAHLPSAGEIALFDRSWYNRAGIESVMGFCTPEQVEEFYRSVPEFERMLVRSGIRLLKFWFEVSREEQARRIERRRADPLRQWKLTPLDLQAGERYDAYTRAAEDMFRRTSIPEAPWIRIDANDKRAAQLEAMRRLLAEAP